MGRPFITLLLLVSLAASAQQIYKTVDENGNIVFTDSPPNDGTETTEVELHRTNTAAPPPAAPVPPPAPLEAAEQAVQYEVSIAEPANETTIAMGPGNFSVSASVSPALEAGASLQLRMDGEPRGEAQPGSRWDLTNVFRGAHDLTVEVLSQDGEVLASSEPVRVYVLRPSVNFRR